MSQVIDPALAITEPSQVTVMELLAQAAQQYPSLPAICKDNSQLSYTQLLEAIAYLARQLAAEGIGTGTVVGIHGGKTLGTIVSMLSTLQIGAIILPLDEELPLVRKCAMLKEGKATFLLLTSDQELSIDKNIQSIFVDPYTCQTKGNVDTQEQITLPAYYSIDTATPAYIFFTSGTTGTPKGILGCHKGLTHFVQWEQNEFAIGPGDRVAQLASISFDAILKDIFPPLLNGGTLVLPTNRPYENPHQLLNWLDEQQITIIQTVPSVVSSWLTTVQQESSLLQAVRLLCLAGEPLMGTLVQNFRSKFSHCHAQISNLYGPTETTILKSFYMVPSQVTAGIQPIGQALPDTQLLILNRTGELCAVGELGEIVIRTKFGTLGYCNGSEEENAHFFPNPWRNDPTDIFYRTGDSGRLELDGTITIAGRLDDQVKIRGVRIQPAEITALLLRHTRVSACVVLPWQRDGQEIMLVAYVVPQSRQSVTAQELREYLATYLPSAMLPSAFIFLDKIPLQANGKVNRKALPEPLPPTARLTVAEQPTPTQELLLHIWKDVLKVEHIGLHENFFSLGGHSLLLFQMISRIRKTFNVGVDLRAFFEYPTLVQLSSHVEALLATAQGIHIPPIVAGRREAPLPLSFAERRLWFLHQLAPESPSYTMAGTFRLKGNLTRAIFEACIRELMERHEALRTIFPVGDDGQPIAVVAQPSTLSITYYDSSNELEVIRELATLNWIRAFTLLPFDLAQGPLFRVALAETGESEHLFTLSMHHSISDGWSWEILRREFFLLWEAFSLGQPSPLPKMTLQYRDFALWQHQRFTYQELDTQIDYWRQRLAGSLPVLNLPTDYPRPAVQTYHGAHHTWIFTQSVSDALQRLARKQGVTLFMVLLAAFSLQLARLCGQEDFILGSDSAGRGHAEVEDIVGFFVNTLALRTHLEGNPTFVELLQRIRETVLEAYVHQDVPFEKLVEALHPERDLSRSPLFQVMLRMSPHSDAAWSASGIEMSQIALAGEVSKFDLTVIISVRQGIIYADFEYNTDLFAARRIVAVQQQFSYLLEQILEKPQEHLSAYSLVPTSAQNLLPDLTRPLIAPEKILVLEEIKQITRATPKALALQAERKAWTYAELLAAVDQLTYQLLASEVEAGQVVAIQGRKHFYSVVAILAVLNAGCVILPLDEQLPMLRRSTMLTQGKASHLICISSCETELTEQCATHFLDVQTGYLNDCPYRETLPTSTPYPPCVQPTDPAYIFFTSGTTGTPKGILGTQQGIAHFVQWERDEFKIGSNDRVAQLTTFSFDAMLRDLFVPLTCGATLCLPSEDDMKSPASLLAWLEAESISIVHTVPSIVSSWLMNEAIDNVSLKTLRLLCLAGEPLQGTLIQQWHAHFPSCRAEIVNFYGPTETTMIKAFYRVPEQPLLWTQPIGYPLSDTQICILGNENQRCGIGEVGEIVIRTPFRTLGYLNAHEDINRGFFQNPFSSDPTDLLYRTGDLGRMSPGGLIRIVGRIDDQVKIRGVRVQPAEVASVLSTHAGIKSSIVLPRARTEDEEMLVAYVICEEQVSVTQDEMREYLSARLPTAMIPAYFLIVEAFPLLPNGKIDRAALAQMELSLPKDTYSPPKTPLQEQLAALWANLLRIERIGIHDNFFAKGGHSLLATLAVTKMRKLFSPDLSLRNLLEHPTIAQMEKIIAALVDEQASSTFSTLVCFRSSEKQFPIFCVHPIGGGVLCYKHLAAALGEDYPFYAFQASGIEEGTTPLSDIKTMAHLYIQELQKVQPYGQLHICGWSLGGVVAFEMARQLREMGREIGFLGLFDSYAPNSGAYDATTDEDMLRSSLLHDMRMVDQEIVSNAEMTVSSEEDGPLALQRRLEVFKAHLKAIGQYIPPKTDLPITLFLAQEQKRDEGITPSLGWQELVRGKIEIIKVPSTHYSMLSLSGAIVLAQRLKRVLLT